MVSLLGKTTRERKFIDEIEVDAHENDIFC